MIFSYINKRFRGEGIDLWCVKGSVFIEVDKHIMKFKTWEDVRDVMGMLEDILPEAILNHKRSNYGKKLVIFPDDGRWTLWYNNRSLEMSEEILRSLPKIFRFFVKKYHKLMLDFNSYKLHEGFEVDIPTIFKYIRH